MNPNEIRLPPEVLEEARRIAQPLVIRDFIFEASTDHRDEPIVRGKIVIDDGLDLRLLENAPRMYSYLFGKISELNDLPSVFYIRTPQTLER